MNYRHTKLYLFIFLVLTLVLPLVSIQVRKKLSSPFYSFLTSKNKTTPTLKEEDALRLYALEVENSRMRLELDAVKEWLQFDQKIAEDVSALKEFTKEAKDVELREFCQRRSEALCQTLEKKFHSLPARVIMRDFSSWNSSLWIGIGMKDNELCGEEIVAPFSPVVLGDVVIGIVEEVKEDVSKVKLIFDPQLSIAVRAVRGKKSKKHLVEHTEALLRYLENSSEIESEEISIVELLYALKTLQENLIREDKDIYLAKGEIKGQGGSKLKSLPSILQGIGFNYHFADVEGPSRDLRTGKSAKGDALKIVEEGDLLVTSGLDGIFPEGLSVAQVTKVHPIQEGQCWCNLEAATLARDIHDLKYVFVLPPMNLSH